MIVHTRAGMRVIDSHGIGVAVILTVILLGVVGYTGWENGYRQGVQTVQLHAITAGMAEWVPDEEGRPVLRWKTPPSGPPRSAATDVDNPHPGE